MLQKDQNNLRPAKRAKVKTDTNSTSKTQRMAPQTNSPKNVIMIILNARGYKSIVPTDDVLQTLDMTLHRFNKILDNKVDMTLTEATGFANWLGVSVEELSPITTISSANQLPSKFGLNN